MGGNLIYFSGQQKDTLREIVDIAKSLRKFEVIRCIDPTSEDPDHTISQGIDSGVVGFKLHPRIHNFNLSHPNVLTICENLQKLRLPIYICAFDDGTWSRLGVSSFQFCDLADRFPTVQFVWMHAGGYRVSEFMFNARRRKNVFLDLSFSVNYFTFGSVPQDLAYSIFSMSGQNWLFGSDNPNFSLEQALEATDKIFMEIPQNFKSESIKELLLIKNAQRLFPNHVCFNE